MGYENVKYEKTITVDKSLCIDGKITYKNLFTLMIDTSNEQSKELNATSEDLIELGYTWMIYKWRVDFEDIPRENEKIRIVTWASDFIRLNAVRDFEVFNESNVKIISASVVLLIVDINKKKPIRIPEEVAKRFGVEKNRNFENIERFKVKGELFSENNLKVQEENIDVNNHVNNAVYVDWIVNSMPEEFRRNYKLKSINIIYHKEITDFEKVCIKSLKSEKNCLYTEISTRELNAAAKSIWKRKLD